MKTIFGKMPDGKDVYSFSLQTQGGLKTQVINYGGTVLSLEVPDKNGKLKDIVLGFDNLEQYLGPHPYFGAVIGRYCNRIANGKFKIDNNEYNLTKNNGGNTLHGGEIKAFHRVFWDIEEFQNKEGLGLTMKYLCKDLDEGFPGNVNAEVVYFFTHKNEFKITYKATTDKPTHVNLTHHSYFNFTGCAENIFNHEIMINAKQITPVNEKLIPTGELKDISNTPFNLQEYKKMGAQIPLIGSKGFDNNYVLNKKGNELSLAAKAKEEKSGISMEIYTTEPGIQFYTGGFIGKLKAKNGTEYDDFYGFALEPQHFPDSPNISHFPSTLLKPGETYKSETVFRFFNS